MREPTLRFTALDRFGHFPPRGTDLKSVLPRGGLSVAAVDDQHFDTRCFYDVRESGRDKSPDEWEHLWIELGGEG
jgi:hypothetical protein